MKRLTDTDEQTRVAAIEGVTEAAIADLSLLEGHSRPLAAVAERLRDVKPAVARTAAEKLLAIFRAYAMKREQGAVVTAGNLHKCGTFASAVVPVQCSTVKILPNATSCQNLGFQRLLHRR